jgi:hypothetical protein
MCGRIRTDNAMNMEVTEEESLALSQIITNYTSHHITLPGFEPGPSQLEAGEKATLNKDLINQSNSCRV